MTNGVKSAAWDQPRELGGSLLELLSNLLYSGDNDKWSQVSSLRSAPGTWGLSVGTSLQPAIQWGQWQMESSQQPEISARNLMALCRNFSPTCYTVGTMTSRVKSAARDQPRELEGSLSDLLHKGDWPVESSQHPQISPRNLRALCQNFTQTCYTRWLTNSQVCSQRSTPGTWGLSVGTSLQPAIQWGQWQMESSQQPEISPGNLGALCWNFSPTCYTVGTMTNGIKSAARDQPRELDGSLLELLSNLLYSGDNDKWSQVSSLRSAPGTWWLSVGTSLQPAIQWGQWQVGSSQQPEISPRNLMALCRNFSPTCYTMGTITSGVKPAARDQCQELDGSLLELLSNLLSNGDL